MRQAATSTPLLFGVLLIRFLLSARTLVIIVPFIVRFVFEWLIEVQLEERGGGG